MQVMVEVLVQRFPPSALFDSDELIELLICCNDLAHIHLLLVKLIQNEARLVVLGNGITPDGLEVLGFGSPLHGHPLPLTARRNSHKMKRKRQ